MKGKRLAFIDIETTGIHPEKHEIIELACVLVDEDGAGYRVVDEFEMKVKPIHLETAEPDALRVNGYNDGDWLFACSLTEALTHLAKKCDGAVMVAQNVSFDYGFIAKGFHVVGVADPFFYAKLDTIPMAYVRHRDNPRLTSYTLRSLCEFYGVKNAQAHTALADARATFEVFKMLMSGK